VFGFECGGRGLKWRLFLEPGFDMKSYSTTQAAPYICAVGRPCDNSITPLPHGVNHGPHRPHRYFGKHKIDITPQLCYNNFSIWVNITLFILTHPFKEVGPHSAEEALLNHHPTDILANIRLTSHYNRAIMIVCSVTQLGDDGTQQLKGVDYD
jgi:hypothetical protein